MSQIDGLSRAAGFVNLDNCDFTINCGSCRACCFGADGPIITDYEAKKYDSHEAEEGKWRLDQKEEGCCVYLGEEGCTIHDIRPKVCRDFDCRSLVLQNAPDTLDSWVEDGKVLEEVIQQGRIRMVQFNKALDSKVFNKIFTGEE